MVANNRRKNKQKRPMGLVSPSGEHTSPCNERGIHNHFNQTTPGEENIRQPSLYCSFPIQKWKKPTGVCYALLASAYRGGGFAT